MSVGPLKKHHQIKTKREALANNVEVAIIGGGLGGLLTGARPREAGIKDIRTLISLKASAAPSTEIATPGTSPKYKPVFFSAARRPQLYLLLLPYTPFKKYSFASEI